MRTFQIMFYRKHNLIGQQPAVCENANGALRHGLDLGRTLYGQPAPKCVILLDGKVVANSADSPPI